MEEQKKTLLFSVILSVFMTAFVVSSAIFFYLYKTEKNKNINQNGEVFLEDEENFISDENKKACPEMARFCDDGSLAKVNDNCETICPEDNPVEDENWDVKEQNNNEETQQQNQGSAVFIPKGAIAWQEAQKVGDLGFLKINEKPVNDIELISADYYLVGKVKSGEYKNFEVYKILTQPNAPASLSFMMLKSGEKAIFLNGFERFDDWSFSMIKDSIIGGESENRVINGNITIEDLVFPEKLSFNSGKVVLNKVGFADAYFKNQSYNILKKAFMSDYGQVWMTDIKKADEIYNNKKDITDEEYEAYGSFRSNAFYIQAKDGNVMVYKLDFSSIADFSGEEKGPRANLSIKLNNNSTKIGEYEIYMRGCGAGNYAYDFSSKVSLGDLVVIGKFKNGDSAYTYRDINHPEFKNLYSKIYFAKDGQKKPEAEFLKTNSQIFWVDPVGRILSFYSTEIISPAECGKPVIYLYPEKEMDVNVQVFPNGGFTITDPVYPKGGWSVKATPKGVLTNYADGKNYPYLFWEGNSDELYIRPSKGFVVSQNDLDKFFDEKLAKLGLNSQEIYDFKEFWIAKMKEENKPFYFITFASSNFINKVAPLKITPKPDSVIRVLMDYESLDEFKKVEELPIITPKRTGFTAVEWGGMLH